MIARWRPYALWASLGVNVFLLTLIGGHMLHRPPPPPELGLLSERTVRELPEADATRVRTVLQQERPRFRAARERLDDARASLSHAISRTPYDPELVSQRLAEFRQRWQEMSDRFTDVLLPILSAMSPEGRAKLVSVADRPRPPRRGGPPL